MPNSTSGKAPMASHSHTNHTTLTQKAYHGHEHEKEFHQCVQPLLLLLMLSERCRQGYGPR
jgi:hypothetical protein